MGADLTKSPTQTALPPGRAGTTVPQVPAQPQPPRIEAAVEGLRDGKLAGWAWMPDSPSEELSVDLYEGMQLLDRRTANEFRPALEQAGKRGGRCGFSFQLPNSLLDGRAHSLTVRLTDGGANLPNGTVQFGPLQVSSLVDEVVALRQAVERLTRIVEENFTADGKLPTELVRTLSDRVASFAEIQRDLVERELDALRAMAFSQAHKQQAQFPASPHIVIRQAMQAAAQGAAPGAVGEDDAWRRPAKGKADAKSNAVAAQGNAVQGNAVQGNAIKGGATQHGPANGVAVNEAVIKEAGTTAGNGKRANGQHASGKHVNGIHANGHVNGSLANGGAPAQTRDKATKTKPGMAKPGKASQATGKPKAASHAAAKPANPQGAASANGAGRHAAATPAPARAGVMAAKRGVKQLSRHA